MAVAVADGATTISDVAVLADQAALFGAVASDSTCWRLLDRLDTPPVWRGRAGAGGRAGGGVGAARRADRLSVPAHAAAGTRAAGLVIDLDAAGGGLLQAARRRRRRRRSSRPSVITRCWATPGSNTAADHILVLDAALAPAA